jgi:NAD(P)-dependent dehydrogenase (short-subunit alcohol dehydrogenase family)
MLDFAGRLAVVTGAACGIGRAISRSLADHGARVIAVDRDDAALAAIAGDGLTTCVGDLSRDTEALAASILARHGPVQLLVNNVGIDTEQGFLDLDEASFDVVLNTNLRGPWFFTRRLVSDMVERRQGGSVLFVSSLHDHVVRRLPHYSASKAAVHMLVRELAYELGPYGVRVNAVSPGVIRSARVPEPAPEEAARLRELIRLRGRIGSPDDVARVALLLLSDDVAGYVTGVNVPVDGGLDLHTWSLPPGGSSS